MGWLAVGDVTANAARHPVVVVSANGTSWQAADGELIFGAPACSPSRRPRTARATSSISSRTSGRPATAASSRPCRRRGLVVAGLTGWQRAGDATAGALDGPGARQMTAVAARLRQLRRGGLARRPAVGLDLGGRPHLGARLTCLFRSEPPGPCLSTSPAPAAPWPPSAPRSPRQGPACALRGQLVQRRGQLNRVGAPGSRGPDVGHGPDPGRRRLHRDRDLRPHPRPSGRGGVDVAERLGVAGGRARRAGPDRAGHPGHHRPDHLPAAR